MVKASALTVNFRLWLDRFIVTSFVLFFAICSGCLFADEFMDYIKIGKTD
ncbi:hypothetical protein GCM10009411_24100 [Shewanella litoralis]|uniref:Uncharacterized protein n=1 Tax=Shewanella litoralis TaxID=2282700 RepID=A0ABQ2RC00_9GAMM|nr:hypothetical protein GCM10009411_24100 [Shewanella litoralis]